MKFFFKFHRELFTDSMGTMVSFDRYRDFEECIYNYFRDYFRDRLPPEVTFEDCIINRAPYGYDSRIPAYLETVSFIALWTDSQKKLQLHPFPATILKCDNVGFFWSKTTNE